MYVGRQCQGTIGLNSGIYKSRKKVFSQFGNNVTYLSPNTNYESPEPYHAQRRFTDAEPLYKRAISLLESRAGTTRFELPVVLSNYSALLAEHRRVAEAAEFERRAKSKIAQK